MIVATIEARMTSTRLPGKVMMLVEGKPILQHLVERVKLVAEIDCIVLATTVNSTDDCIAKLAEKLDIECFRGSEKDVLGRVYDAASKFSAETLVQLTGDNPLVDPALISEVIQVFKSGSNDYASNCDTPSYPSGMNVQVLSMQALDIANRDGKDPKYREHTTWYIRSHPELFKKTLVEAPRETSWPDLRLTLDEQADFELISKVIEHFSPNFYSCQDIVNFMRENPTISQMNSHVMQKTV